jgi:hypothetical protein
MGTGVVATTFLVILFQEQTASKAGISQMAYGKLFCRRKLKERE